MTTVKRCKCKHVWQDKRYGRGMRVHNDSSKGPRCAVCGSEK